MKALALLLLSAWPLAATQSQKLPALIASYEQDLFPHADAFAFVHSLEHGQLIFDKLKAYKPLALVADAFIAFQAQSVEPDEALISFVLVEAEKAITSSGYKRIEKQSNLLALQYLRDYLSRFEPSPSLADGEEGKQKQQEDNQKQNKPQKPQRPKMPDAYKPHTKNTDNKQPGSKEDQVILLETNFATPYFGGRIYSDVSRTTASPFRSNMVPGSSKSIGSYRKTGKELFVYTLGEEEFALFLPPGFEPLQPEDPRAHLTLSADGTYTLKAPSGILSVTVPLEPVQPTTLNPIQREIYTRPVGFSASEWPALIQGDLLDKPFSSDLMKAKAVSHHLATKYLYSVGARAETDPVDALKAGAFQCDMAAYAMVAILRDVYAIPSRVVSGYRGKKHGNGGNQRSYLVLPGEAHAWVEAYVDGKWQPFDPTPVLKDKEKEEDENENGEKDEYSDRSLEDQPLPPPPPPKNANATSTNATVANATQPSKSPLKMDSEELAGLLTLGSLQLSPTEERSSLRERAMRVLLRLILDPHMPGNRIFEKLHQAKGLFLSVGELKGLVADLLMVFEKPRLAAKAWLDDVTAFLDKRDLATTYTELFHLKQTLAGYAKLLDGHGPVGYPTALILKLDGVLRGIEGLAHIDSREIALVSDFYDSLPPLAQTLLAHQYNLVRVGPNAPTKTVAQRLKTGDLNDLKLLALLSKHTDFIMNSTPRPEYEEVRTWVRDARRPVGRDLVGVQRFSELSRASLGNPGKTLEENMVLGTAYASAHRLRTRIATGFGKDDAERITIVLYDTSGSMSGDPERFQAGLISAFTATALSDVSPSGAHRHRLVLVPFDDKPGTPVRVTNTQEALDIIHKYTLKLKNTGGGTDIQAALIQAMALIADAERRSGEPLAAANIVLMTDGQSPLDIPKLAEARGAIDRTTPLQIMFAAIGTTNDDLRQFVSESEKIGIDNGFYREFSNEFMSEQLKRADAPWHQASAHKLYTDKKPADLDIGTRKDLSASSHLLSQFLGEIHLAQSSYAPAEQHLAALETLRWDESTPNNGKLAEHIQHLRRLGYTGALKNAKTWRHQIADDIFKNFEKLTGVPLNRLSQTEQSELKHYFCHAADMGPLGCP
ncbi:MAG: transglutaminase domain-containing protein [Myxococcota bacterium]